jgi:hypothetical protein
VTPNDYYFICSLLCFVSISLKQNIVPSSVRLYYSSRLQNHIAVPVSTLLTKQFCGLSSSSTIGQQPFQSFGLNAAFSKASSASTLSSNTEKSTYASRYFSTTDWSVRSKIGVGVSVGTANKLFNPDHQLITSRNIKTSPIHHQLKERSIFSYF